MSSQDHSVTQETLDDLKDLITATREDLEDQIDQVQQSVGTASAAARDTLQNDMDQLQSSLDSIARAYRVADNIRPKVTIEGNKAGQSARAIFGTDTTQPHFDLNVSGNEAGLGAVMSAGVHSPETLRALLATSTTPALALTLQALQTQSTTTQNHSLHTILSTLSTDGQPKLANVSAEASLPAQIASGNVRIPALIETRRLIHNRSSTGELRK